MIDNVPSDAIVQEGQDEAECCRSGRHEDDPRLAVQVQQIHSPRSASPSSGLVGAVVGEVRCAVFCAAFKGRGKGIWNVELLGRNIVEDCVLQECEQDDGNGNGEIGDDGSDVVVAAKGRVADLAKRDGEKGGTHAKKKTQQGNRH
eukprot:scaffold9334_cov63-Cylindrotheca_fusiformis.AAC.1